MKLGRRIRGYSWVGLLNLFVLQWFFIRLQGTLKRDNLNELTELAIIGPIVPCTGWGWRCAKGGYGLPLGVYHTLTIWRKK